MFNEPNIMCLLNVLGLPPQVWDLQPVMLVEKARQTGNTKFVALNSVNVEDIE